MNFNYKKKIKTNNRNELLDITSLVHETVSENCGNSSGILVVFSPHTTAAITINECADPHVKIDMLSRMKEISPYSSKYLHMEGNSDSHIKTSLFGPSVSIPVINGKLALGTWQGIFFCEFDGPRSRNYLISYIGE
jgi:secondary thiamine-phosphate synthase enzyme